MCGNEMLFCRVSLCKSVICQFVLNRKGVHRERILIRQVGVSAFSLFIGAMEGGFLNVIKSLHGEIIELLNFIFSKLRTKCGGK